MGLTTATRAQLRESLLRYVEMLNEVAPQGSASILLAHAKLYDGAPLPEGIEPGEPNQCYKNAFHTAEAHDLTYCEGYAARPDILGLPIEHAWCVDDTGKVVDTTWEMPQDAVYYGALFTLPFVNVHLLRTGYYGIFGNHWLVPDTPMQHGVLVDEAGRICEYNE